MSRQSNQPSTDPLQPTIPSNIGHGPKTPTRDRHRRHEEVFLQVVQHVAATLETNVRARGALRGKQFFRLKIYICMISVLSIQMRLVMSRARWFWGRKGHVLVDLYIYPESWCQCKWINERESERQSAWTNVEQPLEQWVLRGRRILNATSQGQRAWKTDGRAYKRCMSTYSRNTKIARDTNTSHTISTRAHQHDPPASGSCRCANVGWWPAHCYCPRQSTATTPAR